MPREGEQESSPWPQRSLEPASQRSSEAVAMAMAMAMAMASSEFSVFLGMPFALVLFLISGNAPVLLLSFLLP
jgi:hypothetical protein